ncbi:MAG: glycosyltransferase [Chloroflexota bacterium]
MNILLLNTYDAGGGAENAARDLLRAYRDLGHDARLLVRHERGNDAYVQRLDPYAGTFFWGQWCAALEDWLDKRPAFPGKFRLMDWLRRTAHPQRWLDHLSGADDFTYPASRGLLADPWTPDAIHAHNLHGDYFDMRAFESLGQRVPIVWTLHDTWAFTGHCGHFLECDRWRIGCGHCPDLKRPPGILRDATAKNFRAKRQIYARSNFAVATPSRWLMSFVEQSILKDKERRVIPNGVDLSVFHPGDQRAARRELGLRKGDFICLYVSSFGAAANPYKDFATVARAVELLRAANADIFFVCMGGARESRGTNSLETGFVHDPKRVAGYYRAADVLLHAANAENFPSVILEAMACGTAVVATAVGGIGEQITDGETGAAVPKNDAEAMAGRVLQWVADPARRAEVGRAAAIRVRENFDLKLQASRYVDWFETLVKSFRHAKL